MKLLKVMHRYGTQRKTMKTKKTKIKTKTKTMKTEEKGINTKAPCEVT